MRYADSLLADGERVVYRSRQHWLALAREAAAQLALIVAALVLLLLVTLAGISGTLRDIVSLLGLVLLILGLLWGGQAVWAWRSQDYCITTHRVVKVEGILTKRSADSSLEKINDAILTQTLLGRMLGYGDLEVLTASEEAVDRYRMLNQAPAFKREMLNQKQALERDYQRASLPPSPPLRATPSPDTAAASTPASAMPAPAAPAPSTPATADRAMSADEVTATLARLADLRDRGAITDEEYAAKKADLLGRL